MHTCGSPRNLLNLHKACIQGSSGERCLHHHPHQNQYKLLMHVKSNTLLKIIMAHIELPLNVCIPSRLTMLGWTNFLIKSASSLNLLMTEGSLLVSVFTATGIFPS